MKLKAASRAVDGEKIAETIRRALASAGLDRTSSPMRDINDNIRRALSSAGMWNHDAAAPTAPGATAGANLRLVRSLPAVGEVASDSSCADTRALPGQFVNRSYSNAAGSRAYKLYIPRVYSERCLPLIVMLHGCTQNPDDFAAGTRMNELADKHAFLVAYPAQSANANGSNCWNWFNVKDQTRDRGEPSLLAGITREVASSYRIDEQRIFVAGLSAGAAMAVILGATYPELFAGVGAHSGLAYGAADDVVSAFAAMRGGPGPIVRRRGLGSRTSTLRVAPTRAPPTIVFHGDHDKTVHADNGSEIVSQAITLAQAQTGCLNKSVQGRVSANGRECTITTYRDSMMRPCIEQWVLHGAGHAWSGGCSNGSYIDERGPDSSAEMVRFFLAQG
ncbi:MAG: PHB depolymerase family esterase [Pseudomonadota bacterium]|nr:PHB depolymerase family esterase [Pseudomonadota bacterium]